MTTNSSVIDGTKIDLTKVTFSSKITRLPNGSKSARVFYDGAPFTIQTPHLYMPWGVNPPYSEKDNKNKPGDDDDQHKQDGKNKMSKWSLQMSFKGSEGRDKEAQRVNKFLENMKALDQLFLETIVKNRQEWFDDDKKMSKETAEAIYDRLLRRSVKERVNKVSKEAYPPCIEPKVNCVDGEFQCNVFKMNREKYDKPINEIGLRGSNGEGIIRLTNFYIQQTSCGPTWTLLRLRADESGAGLNDFGFIDVDEDEGDVKPKSNVQIADSDDEDDDVKPSATKGDAEDDSEESEESEDEPEPEPEPVVKKGKAKTATATPAKGKKA